MIVALASALVAATVTIDPPVLPAKGAQEAILSLDRPAMVHLSASAPTGVACSIVDHVRGPFARAGQVGKKACALDLLLDGGTYKWRLQAPAQGKGRIQLRAEELKELNPQPVRLDDGASDTRELHPGEQASYWLRQPKAGRIFVRVYGRTAGEVRLWRQGEWLEPLEPRGGPVEVQPGRQIYEWWIEPELAAGDYRLTVYGTSALQPTQGKASDVFHIVSGLDRPAAPRASSIDLPAWGSAVYELEADAAMAHLVRRGPSGLDASLAISGRAEGAPRFAPFETVGCRILPRALVPQCAATGGQGRFQTIVVRGEPGTPVRLQWGESGSSWSGDGSFAGPGSSLRFRVPSSGDYLVGVHDVPSDRDAAPLGCSLYRSTPAGEELLAQDLMPVSPRLPFQRAFNYGGSGASIQFEATEWGRYSFKTSGDRKSRCELFQLGSARERLTESTDVPGCDVKKLLQAGAYELRLYGGEAGIETLSISGATTLEKPSGRTKSACLFGQVALQQDASYHVELSRVGAISGRALVLRRLPLELDEPLWLDLDAGASVKLPIAAGAAVQVGSLAEAKFGCGGASIADASGGQCSLPAGQTSLQLEGRGPEAVSLSLQRSTPPIAATPPAGHAPKLEPVEALQVDQKRFHDFAREQRRVFTFTVAEAGLYDVTTEGLLATSCELRTPTVLSLPASGGLGRGRNCLVQAYLRPGRYLLAVQTQGKSEGRAGVVMARRPPTPVDAVTTDGGVFFRAAAGELVQQRITVAAPKSKSKAQAEREVRLETSAQGARLSCRLDDEGGWPVVPIPTVCDGTHRLRPGRYLWTQLPLTVESMRHTRAELKKPPLILAGDKPHLLALNQPYTAKLSKKGRDDFKFVIEADLDVLVLLTSRMQGRLYREADEAGATPLEVVPPQELDAPAAAGDEVEVAADGAEVPNEPVAEDGQEAEAPAEPPAEASEPAETNDLETLPPRRASRRQRRAEAFWRKQQRQVIEVAANLPALPGHRVHLPAGAYRLVTEHSRADVAIRYAVQISAATLAPGMSREVPVPLRTTLRLPRAGTLRLRTEGDTDVRCRILDAAGKPLAESEGRGDDWNCALAEPLPAGDHTLVIESETLQPGKSRLHLAFAPEEDVGPLGAPRTLSLGKGVVLAALPASTPGAVLEVSAKSTARFSCALETESGRILRREAPASECALLVKPGASKLRLRLWTLEGAAKVTATLRERPIGSLDSAVPAGAVVSAEVERPGRYETGPQILCLPEHAEGAFAPCGPEASLEAGRTLFAVLDPNASATLRLHEQVVPLDGARTETWQLSAAPFLERERSARRALHLVSVQVPFGDRSTPACQSGQGARVQGETTCFAAAGLVTESLARLWTAEGPGARASVTFTAVQPPEQAAKLTAGRQQLSWSGALGRYALPDVTTRIELTLPGSAWAVLTDGRGVAFDLCPPAAGATALDRCALGGSGGELLVYSPGEPRAMATVLRVPEPAAAIPFEALYEERASAPGVSTLSVQAGLVARRLTVVGAQKCVVELEGGGRSVGCRETIPAAQAARVTIERAAVPWRAVLSAPGAALRASFGREPAGRAAPELAAAEAHQLEGSLVERTLRLARPAVVHLHADAGVCGLFLGGELLASDGLGGGCDLHRLLPAGDARLVIRPFASAPLSGSLHWTADEVTDLSEGVGAESWIEPGQVRLFRFAAKTGSVGLGLRVAADALECAVLDERQKVLGDGCQQLLQLQAGSYLLLVRSPPVGRALRFQPVLLGLEGRERSVPDDYLQAFFRRIEDGEGE